MSDCAPVKAEVHAERSETAAYCEKMCHELASMASNSQLNFLAYMLSMAEEEARQERKRYELAPAKGVGVSEPA